MTRREEILAKIRGLENVWNELAPKAKAEFRELSDGSYFKWQCNHAAYIKLDRDLIDLRDAYVDAAIGELPEFVR